MQAKAQRQQLVDMAATAHGARVRNNPFVRDSSSPAPAPTQALSNPSSHARTQSFSPLGSTHLGPATTARRRAGSVRTHSHNLSTSTFAPQFIKLEESQRTGRESQGIEGENDFSGKRYVWLRDPSVAFVKGWIVEELGGGRLLVQCDDGSVRIACGR